MGPSLRWLLPLLLAMTAHGALAWQAEPDSEAKLTFFEEQVRPLFVANCHACHSADTNSRGGLRVDDRNGLLEGGSKGPAVVPGKPDESLLLKAVRHAGPLKMPPEKHLAEEEIAILERWIREGAVWPQPRLPGSVGANAAEYEKLKKEHWAWQPLTDPAAPAVSEASWPRDDIDRFILARLEAASLKPAADADKLALIRRAKFDLTGLPPTLEGIDAFLADSSPTAFEKLVDGYLASPAFGERWGRHWLDVARYGESTGSARNLPMPHAWRYRDYVIDAFNADKPYDVFLKEQIAGDLLPATSPAQKAEQLVATGFLALGVKDVNQRFKVRFIMDNVDEQIDTVSRAILGLTASCARCHDHKFDPIPTTDYYALAGIFRSSDLCAGLRNKMGGGGLDYYDAELLLTVGMKPVQNAPAAKRETLQKELETARAEFQRLRDSPEGAELGPDGRPKRAAARQRLTKLQNELQSRNDPALLAEVAYGVRDAAKVSDTEIRIRGEAEKLGPVVPRGFLGLVTWEGAPRVNPKQSGRLELAEWLASEKNPLTSRVIVNRVWHHLFGKGLVQTVDNFGTTGDVPSHPELLDHLAQRFLRDGWSIKKLVRTIVLTRAYQLGSEAPEANLAADPANRLVWRHSPRRLEAEEIRDALLAVAGRLDLTPLAGSSAQDLKVTEVRNNGPEAVKLAQAARTSTRRSVYLPLLRTLTPPVLHVFDFAEQGMVTGDRDTTTVPPQALYLLNDPFVLEQSLALASRVLKPADVGDADRVRQIYRLAYGRPATTAEVDRALAYVADYESAARGELAFSAPNKAATAETVEENATDATESKKPAAQAVNPDDPVPPAEAADAPPPRAADARTAAWASFCQAVFGSAEFRYVR